MALFRQISLYILGILTMLSLSTLATEYTRFEDLPHCGQACLQKSISYALVKADCGTSLACACKSGKFSDYILSCLRNNKPCSEEPTFMDIIRYQAAYYCNSTSDQRVRYTIEVGGAKKTLTLQGNEVQSTSYTTGSTSHTTPSSSRPTPSITLVTAQPSTSEEAPTSTTTIIEIKTSTVVKSASTSTLSTETSKTIEDKSTRTSDTTSSTASTSTPSSDLTVTSTSSTPTSTSSTSNSSSSDHASSAESVPPGVTVVDASTTIMGHTVTVKATTLVTATVRSGTGLSHLEAILGGPEEHMNTLVGICIASVLGLALFVLG